jgi:hypothetical protein
MKFYLKYFSTTLIIIQLASSCTNEATPKNSENATIAKLNSQVRLLTFEIKNKDSLLNESILTFNEIQNNLAKIANKENEIRIKTGDVNLNKEGKAWVLQEIRNINFLREENNHKIKQLNAQLKNKNIEITELKNMVNRLSLKVHDQNQQIASLQDELANLDAEYVKLFDAYQEQTLLNYETLKELNKSYYVVGSLKELKANNVIIQEGGFIGIGENTLLKDNFNEKYFTEIDRRKTKTIKVIAKKIEFITDHPSSSYTIEDKGSIKIIQINNPDAFWKISRYLVIISK